MQPAQAVDMAAAAAHQGPDVALVGRRVKLRVEIIVGDHEGFEIAGLGQLLLMADHAVEIRGQRLVFGERQHPHDLELQRLPQEMRLLRQPHVDPADDGGMLREDVDQALFLEPHQGVADRRRADAELGGEPRPRQRRSRRQLKRNDRAAQPLKHLRRGLPFAIQPFGGWRRAAAGGVSGVHR